MRQMPTQNRADSGPSKRSKIESHADFSHQSSGAISSSTQPPYRNIKTNVNHLNISPMCSTEHLCKNQRNARPYFRKMNSYVQLDHSVNTVTQQEKEFQKILSQMQCLDYCKLRNSEFEEVFDHKYIEQEDNSMSKNSDTTRLKKSEASNVAPAETNMVTEALNRRQSNNKENTSTRPSIATKTARKENVQDHTKNEIARICDIDTTRISRFDPIDSDTDNQIANPLQHMKHCHDDADSYDNANDKNYECRNSPDIETHQLQEAPILSENDQKRRSQRRIAKTKNRSIWVSTQMNDDEDGIDENEFDEKEDDPESSQNTDSFEVSLDLLKEKIMGRKLETSTFAANKALCIDPNPMAAVEVEHKDVLKIELGCPICHDILYVPVTILCGHSFCDKCLQWWIAHSVQDQQHVNPKCPTCRMVIDLKQYKTCCTDDGPFQTMSDRVPVLNVNVALKTAIRAIFPNEIMAKDMEAKKIQARAISGENAGEYNTSRGYEVLNPMEKDKWQLLAYKDFTKNERFGLAGLYVTSMSARRSIILDAYDERMQLCLALYSNPSIVSFTELYGNDSTSSFLHVDLCLLHVEEDEAEAGLPMVAYKKQDDDDVNLISRNNPNYFSSIEVSIVAIRKTKVSKPGEVSRKLETSTELHTTRTSSSSELPIQVSRTFPLARKELGETGIVSFKLDLAKISDKLEESHDCIDANPIMLQFCHTETQAQLEIQLLMNGTKYDNKSDSMSYRRQKHKTSLCDSHQFETKSEATSDDENWDEFEDDGFIVFDDEDNSESENEEHDYSTTGSNSSNINPGEDDGCNICHDGGELLICDGGDHQAQSKGCQRAFHLGCIGLDAIPEGDWICEGCAKQDLSIDCGIGGYEFCNHDKNDNRGTDDDTRSLHTPFTSDQNKISDDNIETLTVDAAGGKYERAINCDSSTSSSSNSDQDSEIFEVSTSKFARTKAICDSDDDD